MGVRHNGQPLSIAATASVQLSQNREWPHGRRATPVRGELLLSLSHIAVLTCDKNSDAMRRKQKNRSLFRIFA